MNSLAVLWAQFGPYHLARAAALKQQVESGTVHAIELANQTRDYAWKRVATDSGVVTLCPDATVEELGFARVFRNARQTFADLKIEVCLLPSYAPRQSLAALLAAKSLGIRTVMMNESHAGTARSGPLGTWIKRRLVAMFDAALVGGGPQKRYFTELGMAPEKIFIGYDAVDNDYFAQKAEEVRNRSSEVRGRYQLPENYFLSLGRFVAKKNLPILIHGFRKFLDSQPDARTHLVMVGAGEEEPKLRSLCSKLSLPICDHRQPSALSTGPLPHVHFYGFRQIEENPVFYALADAFVLPSLYEEWGLVVNEAMASGLPVIVSKTAGCAEDLLENAQRPTVDLRPVSDLRLRDAARNGVRRNGFVFDPQSAEELAAIFRIFETQPALRRSMGAASREIVEKFSCRNFAENALRAADAAMGWKREPTISARVSQA